MKIKARAQKAPKKPKHEEKQCSFVAPFFKSHQGEYIHIARDGKRHYHNGELLQNTVRGWCGFTGHLGPFNTKATVHVKLRDGQVLCATCAGRATGAKLNGKINNQPVKFKPRK